MIRWRGPLVITGTDTGVGKTVVAAGITAAATLRGQRVAVLNATLFKFLKEHPKAMHS